MLFRWFRKERKEFATRLYDTVLAQARLPVFYKDHGVPDTVTGRFEMTVLHAFLAWNRLRSEGRDGQRLAQDLFDVMFNDMDRALRNIGVGDLAVPHHIRRMMKGFKGRAMAYHDALCAPDEPQMMRDALARNLFGTVEEPETSDISFFAGYIRESAITLAGQGIDTLLVGNVEFMKIGDGHESRNVRAA